MQAFNGNGSSPISWFWSLYFDNSLLSDTGNDMLQGKTRSPTLRPSYGTNKRGLITFSFHIPDPAWSRRRRLLHYHFGVLQPNPAQWPFRFVIGQNALLVDWKFTGRNIQNPCKFQVHDMYLGNRVGGLLCGTRARCTCHPSTPDADI